MESYSESYRKSGVDILLFGHTHRAYCQQLEACG